MRTDLSSDVRRLIAGSKLIAMHAPANVGLGNRRSKAVGAGIEFAQYRDYEPGDDLRYLDRHVYARHGRTVVKQFHLEQQLRVSVLLDASGSMSTDAASWGRAVELAALFGEVVLHGSDQVRFGFAKGASVLWGQVASREGQLRREVGRLETVRPGGGQGKLAETASGSLEALAQPGMLIVISDWLLEGYVEALKIWRARGQEIIAVQVLGAAEAGVAPGAAGWLRMVDAETGETVDRRTDAHTWQLYRRAVDEWSDQVRSAVWAVEGRWVTVSASRKLDDSVVRDLRRLGMIT